MRAGHEVVERAHPCFEPVLKVSLLEIN